MLNSCTDVDIRAPAERCPILTVQNASATRHAMPGLPSARHGWSLPFGRPGAALAATEPSRRPMVVSAVGRNRPDLHDQTVKGALLLSPSPPAIAPSQLRLVKWPSASAWEETQ